MRIVICAVLTGWALAAFAAGKSEEKAVVDPGAQAPYANDLGPATLDVSGYPAGLQKTYKGALMKCAKCHSLARPLNSEFLELDTKAIDGLTKSDPDALKDAHVLRSEDGIWKRYVKRMMAKPGCEISTAEGKAIWEFLAHDSKERKTGKSLAKWIKHRKKLLEDFKAKHPDRYKELYGKK